MTISAREGPCLLSGPSGLGWALVGDGSLEAFQHFRAQFRKSPILPEVSPLLHSFFGLILPTSPVQASLANTIGFSVSS